MLTGKSKTLDRTSAGFALQFALFYFGLSDEDGQRVVGREGLERLRALWEARGQGLYEDPYYVLRQEWFHGFGWPMRRVPMFFHSLPADARLLDYGCGTAELIRRDWIDQGRTTVLMDLSDTTLDYLRCKYPFEWVKAQSVTDPIDGQFDAIVCTDVFEHITRPMDLVERLWRHLKPGGQALFWFDHSYPHPGHLREAIDQIPAYESWLDRHAKIRVRQHIDWIQKPNTALGRYYVAGRNALWQFIERGVGNPGS